MLIKTKYALWEIIYSLYHDGRCYAGFCETLKSIGQLSLPDPIIEIMKAKQVFSIYIRYNGYST